MSALSPEIEIVLPGFFSTPPPETMEAIEKRRLSLLITEQAMQAYAEARKRNSEATEPVPQSILDAEGSRQTFRSDTKRMLDGEYNNYKDEVYARQRQISPDRTRALAAPLLEIMTEHGAPMNPGQEFFRSAHVQSRTDQGLYLTAQVRAQRRPVIMGTERFMDFHTFDEAVALHAELPPERQTSEEVVELRIYASTAGYPDITDPRRRPGTPEEFCTSSIRTNGPTFWGHYPGVAPQPIPVALPEDRLVQLEQFIGQLPAAFAQQNGRVAA